MKFILLLITILLAPTISRADEPTLSDLPSILQKMRGCSETRIFLGTETRCFIKKEDLWASVDSEGRLTLFRRRSYGDTTYATGSTVTALLHDFASKINEERETSKIVLDAIARHISIHSE